MARLLFIFVLCAAAACDSAAPEAPRPILTHEISTKALPDTTIGIDAAPVVVNLHRVFTHTDGLALTFGAPGLAGGSVRVEMHDSLVTITPALHGLTTLQFSASALDGATAQVALQVHVVVPDRIEITGSPAPEGTLTARAGQPVPVARYFHQLDGRPLHFEARVTGSPSLKASIVGDSAVVVYGVHNAQGQVTVVAVDRGFTKEISFGVVVDDGRGPSCPGPAAGCRDYLQLLDGDRLNFTLEDSRTNAGLGGYYHAGIVADAVWNVSLTSSNSTAKTYLVTETASGSFNESGNSIPTISIDTSWVKVFSLIVTGEGNLYFTNYHTSFPPLPIFYPLSTGPTVEFKLDEPSNRGNGDFYRATLDAQRGLLMLRHSFSTGGAGHTDSRVFQLDRK